VCVSDQRKSGEKVGRKKGQMAFKEEKNSGGMEYFKTEGVGASDLTLKYSEI